MKTALLCVAFYGLGVFNCAMLAAVYLLHRPRYVAPTMHNRKWRDAPKPPTIPSAEQQQQDMGGVDYKWLGMTGSEQE